MARLVNLSWIKISSSIIIAPAPMRGIVKRTALLLLVLAWSNQISADTQLGTHTSGNCTVGIYSDINNKQYITVTKSSGTGRMADASSYSWSGAKTNIRFINIANEVTYISTNSFEGFSNLTFLMIGSGVSEIGTSAFKDCSSLRFVVFKGGTNPSGTDAFTNVGTLSNPVELYVPNISSNNVVSTLGLSTTSTTGVYSWKGGYFKLSNSLPVISWTSLKDAMATGGNIKLAGDCTDPSPSSSSYLEVPSGKTVTLDLNGYTINHNLTTSVNLGWVIKVNGGTLTINDSSTGKTGKITGGHFGPSNMAGGIYNLNGTVTINGGSIINNTGNGICNKEASSRLTINGGTISGNTNYGIYNEGTLYLYGGTFSDNNGALITSTDIHIQGTIDITGNSTGTNYLKLAKFRKMIVDGALSNSTRICVNPVFSDTNPYPRVITSGLNGNGSIDNFTSLSSDYAVRQDNYREAALKVVYSPTLNMANWTYGGTPSNPSLSINPGNGVVTYTYKADGATSFTDTKPIIAGTHTVKAVVSETAGYTSAEVTTSYTVAQREATLSWTNTALTYNGTAQKPTASLSNLVTGDACTVTVSGEQTNAGDYTATASALTGDNSGNYKLPAANSQAFTISRKAITVTPDEGQSKTYGEDDPTLTYTVDDIVSGESLSGSLSRSDGSDVGNYAITQGNVTDANNSNYTITFTSGKTFAITQKTATLGWNATSFDYNGSAQAPTASVTNLEAGDDCGVTVSVTGDHSAVGSYTATASALSGTSSGNYVLPEANTQVYEIVRSMGITFTGTQHWNTYCAFEDLATPAGLTAYIITGVSGTTATASVIGYIPKDVGVLLYSASAGSGFKASAYTGTAGTFTSNKLVGVTAATSLAAEAGYILYSDAFVLTTGGMLPANRCYLPASGPASSRGLNIDTGDGTTFINAISKDEMNDERWFDLQGQRIARPQKKGVYIRNGKKVVIK